MKNLRRLECKFVVDQSERKSSQVNASARKPVQTNSQIYIHIYKFYFNLSLLASLFGQDFNHLVNKLTSASWTHSRYM